MKKKEKSKNENSSKGGLIHNVFDFLTNRMWMEAGQGLEHNGLTRRVVVPVLKPIYLTVRSFQRDNFMRKASAMSYYTVFAIVPMFALVLAIGRGFGFQDVLDQWIARTFAAHSEVVPYFMSFVQNYLENARGGLFVGIGLAVLLWSVVSLFRQIENSMNDIWNVKKSRHIARQFTMYISLFLLAPVLIVASSGLTVFVSNYLTDFGLGQFQSFLIKISPYILYWLLFTLLFYIIPNTHVKLRPALLAGLVTALAFQLLQWLYVSGQMSLSKYNSVYGTFAAIPLLLAFLQLVWLIVLCGAELSYASQNMHSYDYEQQTDHISVRYQNYVSLLILRHIILAFDKGDKPMSAERLTSEHHIPSRLTERLLARLVEAHLIVRVEVGDDAACYYQPATDTHTITVGRVFDVLNRLGSNEESFVALSKGDNAELWQRFQQACDEKNALSDVLVRDL